MKYFLLLLHCFSLYSDISMEEFDKICSEMKWVRDGCHELPQSHSNVIVPDEHVMLIGNDAIRYRSHIDGIADDNSIEAVVFAKYEPYDSVILKSYHKEGYIPLSDWQSINANALMALIIANTEEANRQRHLQGIEEKIEVIGWVKVPSKDSQTNTVFWAIEAAQGNEHIVNSIAIKLSRHGYEQFTWVTPKAYYQEAGGELDLVLKSHQFNTSDRYEKYVSGDRVADYDILGLIEEVSGAKVMRTNKRNALLLLYVTGIALALFAGIFYFFLKAKKLSHI